MSEKLTAGIGKGTPGPGRKKGIPNKSTRLFRDTINKLLDDNADNVSLWLTQVAADDPAKALDLMAKLAEYAAPKLSRTELTGEDGAPIMPPTIVFQPVSPN